MKSFLQFLREEVVPFYHKTFPETAQRLQSGQKIYPSGLSVFLDPDMATNYTAQTSAGHIPSNAATVTGTVSTRRLVPDLEWHPEAYNELLSKVNPDRPPTLHINRTTPGGEPYRYTIPGVRTETDPQTGKKKPAGNWKVGRDASGKPVLEIGTSIMEVGGKKTINPNTGTRTFGGSATSGGKFGYQETPWLDIFGRKQDVSKVTTDFIETGTPNEAGSKAFRTRGGSGVKINATAPEPVALPATRTKTGMRLPGVLSAVGAFLPLAFGASPAEAGEAAVHGLNPLSMFGDTPAGLGSDQVDYDYSKYYDSQGRPRRSAWPANTTDVQGKPITDWSPEINEQRKNTPSRYRK